MSKRKFFVDFDNCITNSTKSYCNTYNLLYTNHPKFKLADYEKVNQYNLKDQCPLVKEPLDIFKHEYFFKYLDFINDNTYEVLEKLSKKYQLIVVSVGTPLNLALKSIFLVKKLPFIKDYILLYNDGCKMDKSIVSMDNNSIFIDDIPSNLRSTNAGRKILFGKIFSWNEDGVGEFEQCLNWSEVGERFL